jgi:glycosyltransferase involved in cell wall biosynthesis
MKKKIGIIGQFPPPMHGLSKALDTLYNSYLSTKYQLVKFDITDNKKFINRILEIMKSNLDIYYLTISQSKFGNIRDLIILKVIQMKKKKIIIHLHGGGFRNLLEEDFGYMQKKLNCRLLNKLDVAIVLGDSLRYSFEGIIDDNKIKVVKNCVDDEFVLDDETFKQKMSLFEDKKVLKVLYLSNFIEDKGYKDVLKLAKHTRDNRDGRFKFLFAGKFFNEEDKKEFFKYINDNKLRDIVEFKGIVYGDEKKALIKESDYFILLTRYKNEGQPISIIEAVANGLRVITTNHAGIKDILNFDEMIVCDKNQITVERIYDDISKEYCNRIVVSGLLKKNREKILNIFSEKMYLEGIDNIFINIK